MYLDKIDVSNILIQANIQRPHLLFSFYLFSKSFFLLLLPSFTVIIVPHSVFIKKQSFIFN